MKLNHINLVVADVADAVNFFETHFRFSCTEVKGDNVLAVLKDPEGFTLVVMRNKEGDPVYPEAFHIGFILDDEEQVTTVYEGLKNAGVALPQGPRKIRDSYGFYLSFQNIMIEVTQYLS